MREKLHTWKEASFKYTNEHPDNHNHRPMLCESSAQDDSSPGEGKEREPIRRAKLANDQVGRDFEDEVRDKKDKKGNGVTAALIDSEIGFHARNSGDGQLRRLLDTGKRYSIAAALRWFDRFH
jgi:hypothetical protein